MSRIGKVAGIAGAALGVVAAGAVANRVAERRLDSRRSAEVPMHEMLGSLRGDAVGLVMDDGVVLHAEVDEAPGATGPTLVFVHGFALNLDCWHFQRGYFRGRHRMAFYDQRSHGRSERAPKESSTIEQLGEDLRRVIDELVPNAPVVLIGHSMGGMTIMALAEEHPGLFGDRVVGVGLISTTAGGLNGSTLGMKGLPGRAVSRLAPPLVAGLARTPALVDGGRRAVSEIGYFFTRRLAFGTDVPPSYVDFVDQMLTGTSYAVIAEFYPNFDALDKYAVLEAFSSVPTLIVSGTEDRLTSIELNRKMATLVEGAELVECVDGGHMVMLEMHEQVNGALQRLLDRARDLAAHAS